MATTICFWSILNRVQPIIQPAVRFLLKPVSQQQGELVKLMQTGKKLRKRDMYLRIMWLHSKISRGPWWGTHNNKIAVNIRYCKTVGSISNHREVFNKPLFSIEKTFPPLTPRDRDNLVQKIGVTLQCQWPSKSTPLRFSSNSSCIPISSINNCLLLEKIHRVVISTWSQVVIPGVVIPMIWVSLLAESGSIWGESDPVSDI